MIRILMVSLLIPMGGMAQIAPDFPEPHHYYVDRYSNPSIIGHVFHSRGFLDQQTIGIAVAHQNREWDYNWLLTAVAIPRPSGIFSFGYSNYSSSKIPVTGQDNISFFLESFESDTFEIFTASYQPAIKDLTIQFMLNYKQRRLLDISPKHAWGLDARLSAASILNNQLGLRLKNILSTPYKNKDSSENLAQYVALFYTMPMSPFFIFLETEMCLNYSDLSNYTGQLQIDLDQYLSLIFTGQYAASFSSLAIGSVLTLSDYFNLSYMHQNEKTLHQQLSIHTISIGVLF